MTKENQIVLTERELKYLLWEINEPLEMTLSNYENEKAMLYVGDENILELFEQEEKIDTNINFLNKLINKLKQLNEKDS